MASANSAALEAVPFDLTGQSPITLDHALSVLGVPAMRHQQEQIIAGVLEGRDVVAIMATGAGKSLCYQAPALVLGGLTVVVSPLIALMSDQHERIAAAGVPVEMIAGSQEPEQARQVLERLEAKELRMVFCSPERFAQADFMRALRRNRIALLAVDEAHCVVEWGDDFRPEYMRLGAWRDQLEAERTLALTASATEETTREIAKRLSLRDHLLVRGSVDRPNITFDVAVMAPGSGLESRKLDHLLGAIADPAARPAIVYCGTRSKSETVSWDLKQRGLSAAPYHAGLSASERAETQAAFMEGTIEVICATSAFGMGVDKADVRTVVHWMLPPSIEAYYQEAGRAGRDGAPSRALMLAAGADKGRLVFHNNRARPTAADAAQVFADLKRGVVSDLEADDQPRLELALLARLGALEPVLLLDEVLTMVPREEELSDDELALMDHWLSESADRRWDRYHQIEDFVADEGCRRAALVGHFGDSVTSEPLGRCCDLCGLAPTTAPGLSALAGHEAQGWSRWMSLCEWRHERAMEGEVAHNSILSDEYLLGLYQAWPTDADALRSCPGIGPIFISEHASSLLRAITGSEDGEMSETERALLARREALRDWQAASVPSDERLEDEGLLSLAQAWPRSRDDLMGMPGVGSRFARRHGRELVRFMRAAGL